MGVNLFVEGNPAPILIYIKLQRDVSTSLELNDVASALASIDTLLRQEWPRLWSGFRHRRGRQTYIVKFHVSSPPEFTILSDPAWLAVFIAILAGYRNIKDNVGEFQKDVSELIKGVRGLSDRQLQLLEIGVRLSLERMLSTSEQASRKMADRLSRIRKRLVGEDGSEAPEIRVVDIDKDKPW